MVTSTTRFFKQTVAILATSSGTNGLLGAIEVAGPRGAVPPRHVHHREDEAFYILEGNYSVFVGDEVVHAAPGTWVWGPRGIPHGYEIRSPRGRHMSLTMPGGFEGFFEEVASIARPDADPRTEISRLAVVAARYGVDLLGPAPTPR